MGNTLSPKAPEGGSVAWRASTQVCRMLGARFGLVLQPEGEVPLQTRCRSSGE
jgi:hypothetical protein